MNLFPPVKPLETLGSVCPDCGISPYRISGDTEWECDCGKPVQYMYTNNCWNCKSNLNELNSKWSKNHDMGLVCYCCGKDLFEFKILTGQIKLLTI